MADPRLSPLILWVVILFLLQHTFSRIPSPVRSPPTSNPESSDTNLSWETVSASVKSLNDSGSPAYDSLAASDVQVFTIPVGQGDSTVIRCPNGEISIIDMGCLGGCGITQADYINLIKTSVLGNDYSKLKRVFLTHPDDDHLNYGYAYSAAGASGLLIDWRNNKPTGAKLDVYLGNSFAWWVAQKNFVTFLDTTADLKKHWKSNWQAHPDVQICSDPSTTIKIIASDLATGAIANSKNARSMVMSLRIGDVKKMLFLGDFEKQTTYNTLLFPGSPNAFNPYIKEISQHPILVVPHHGSGSEGNPNSRFYNVVDPKHAIVSSAMWSVFKHPKIETLQAICGSRTTAYSPNFDANPIGWIRFGNENTFMLQQVENCDVDIYQTSRFVDDYYYQLYTVISTLSSTKTEVTTSPYGLRTEYEVKFE